jgi:hypothetical protein
MRRSERLWLIAVFAVAMAFAGPGTPAHAAPRSWHGMRQVWSWLAAMVPRESTAQTSFDWGGYIDPNG